MKKGDVNAIYSAKNQIRLLKSDLFEAIKGSEKTKTARIQQEIEEIRSTIYQKYSVII